MWKQNQKTMIDNAMQNYFEIMNKAKIENITDNNVQQNITKFMQDNHDVTVSVSWLRGIFYQGANALEKAAWINVQAFIDTMNDPRTAGQVLQKMPSIYIGPEKIKNKKVFK